MTWGDDVWMSVIRENNDGSYRYQVQVTKRVSKEDNGKTVICKLNKKNVKSLVEERTLNVLCECQTLYSIGMCMTSSFTHFRKKSTFIRICEHLHTPSLQAAIAVQLLESTF